MHKNECKLLHSKARQKTKIYQCDECRSGQNKNELAFYERQLVFVSCCCCALINTAVYVAYFGASCLASRCFCFQFSLTHCVLGTYLISQVVWKKWQQRLNLLLSCVRDCSSIISATPTCVWVGGGVELARNC